jgi:hypothetical protein
MSLIRSAHVFMNCYATWCRLGWAAGQMTTAAVQVFGHRTRRFVVAGAVPSARDRREFALMGQEKGEAALEAAQAVGLSLLRLNQQFSALVFKQTLSTLASVMSISASRTGAEFVGLQSTLLRNTINGYLVTSSKLSGSTAQLARRALNPVHTRVSGNLKRLGKISK